MKNQKNIQEILDKKALKKLEKDVKRFLEDITDSPIWDSISKDLTIEANPDKKIEKETLRSFFWPPHTDHSSGSQGWAKAAKMMLEKLLPQYIESESKAFFEMVNGLQGQLDNFDHEYPDPE